ncbi:MAG: response regulator [Chloroflexota bacterium]
MATILIIDDEPQLLSNIAQLLEYEGHTALACLDGENVLQTAFEYPIDLVLCDMLMPTLNGFQILQAIRENPQTAHVPFVFVTAVKWDPEVETGATGYIIKPFTNDELLAVIHQQLSG